MGSVPVIGYDEERARLAFEVHAALCCAERELPQLCSNPFWTILRQDAFEQFYRAFEAAR